MDRFFSLFGKLALILIIIGVLVTGGYYFGTGKLPFPTSPPPAAVTTTAPEAVIPSTVITTAPTAPTPTPQPIKTIKAGVTSGLSFSAYTIEVPADWKVTQQHEDAPSPMDTLTLIKGTYSMKIFQAATGGAMCLFPGDPDVEGPSSRYTTYVTITTKDGATLRRADTTLCQKSSDGSYGQPTMYGHISVGMMSPPDEAILKEMDTMIASLKKI